MFIMQNENLQIKIYRRKRDRKGNREKMNQFTEYCNRLIQEESDSVYHFCLKHHLERTGIRRMLSGERVPKDELFQEFLRALTLTPDEEKKLTELYQRQKIGEKRYENRIFVKEMLEYIGEIQMFSIENSDRKQETQIESVQKWGGVEIAN